MRALGSFFLLAGLAAMPVFAQARADQPRVERFLERWQQMSADEKEAALSRLPPERRARLEQRLKRLESLSEEDRAELRQRFEEFQALPPARRDALRLEIQALRAMRPPMRRRRMNSPAFQRLYSMEEQKLLRQALGME